REVAKYCAIDDRCERLLQKAFEKLNLSARGTTRILKVARTIADIEGSQSIEAKHIAEAIQYRGLDKKYN
ncbi:MAG: magnesium chelatase, partial [Clostridia bacterium]